MHKSLSRTALLACVLGVTLSAQAQQPTTSVAYASELIRLRYASFDPVHSEPAMPEALQSRGNLWIAQFAGVPTESGRSIMAALGVTLHGYLPHNAYVVRMSETMVDAVRAVPGMRWVGRYHTAYRLDPALIAALEAGGLDQVRRYNIVVADKHGDKPALMAGIRALGGTIASEETGSLLIRANLTGAQLQQAADLDQVLWIDEWSAPEEDMDNARIQGGGNYVEAQVGYTGSGVNAHIYEGIEATHQDFTGGATNISSGGGADTHGHCTAGIVFGNGTSNAAVRGMAPDCGKFFTQYSTVTASRWQVISDLVNIHNVSHTTASWGDARTLTYNATSAETDDIIFDHDIVWTQSQSNAHNQQSRPQAWAKNIFSIGGVQHYNNSSAADDSWNAGGGSTGPAADGRIKPTLSAYYDAIGTSDRSGSLGYSANNWYASFGGTSGATPIVAGHNVLAIQMFTDDSATPGVGPFGNQLRSPGSPAASFVHDNRPHFTTLKALQVASAYMYDSAQNGNTRMHVGWGFPDLRKMWDMRGKTMIVDETDVLTQGQTTRHDLNVASGEPVFYAVLNYADPAAVPSAAITLINNLSLKVTDPNGTIYWGNNGLTAGDWSVAGGAEDTINPIECVKVQNPVAGVWHIDVIATSIVQDSHV
ncbi:MAG: S8 family serine peptidase, partial [Planctomycetes bacterium]|nr:S8 family serine peptidase [Planctomycetota bacterium]